MTATEQFEQLLQEIVQEKTFSFDAVEQIKKLKKDYEDLLEKNENTVALLEDTKRQLEEERQVAAGLQNTLDYSLGELKKWEEREKELIEKENRQEVKDVRLECANQSKNDMMEMMRVVFRNPVAQRSVMQREQKYDDYGNELYDQWDRKAEVITRDEVNPETDEQ